MNTYYFNNSDWVYSKKVTVITENAFRKIWDNNLDGWNSHWLTTEAKNLAEATKHFTETWCK